MEGTLSERPQQASDASVPLNAILAKIIPTREEIAASTELVQSVFSVLEKLKQEASYLNILFIKAVGSFIKGTMLRGHNRSDLVMALKYEPTPETMKTLFHSIKGPFPTTIAVDWLVQDCVLLIASDQAEVAIYFTWPQEACINSTEARLEQCSFAPAMQKHVQWFDAMARSPSVKPAMQLMKYYQTITPSWKVFNPWTLEVLVAKCASSQPSLAAAIRRVFEVVSAGCLLPGGVQLFDPCVNPMDPPQDLFAGLSLRDRKEATLEATKALIRVAYKKWEEVFFVVQ